MPIDWTNPQRQHRSAIFIILTNEIFRLIKMLWPLILIMILRSGRAFDIWDLLVFGVSAVTIINAVVEYFYFRFNILNKELIIRKGWLARQTIVLPLERIQAVHIEQTWLHSLFGSVRVAFDSSGSEKMEVKIHALDSPRAESLRSYILDAPERVQHGEDVQIPEPEKPLISLGTKDLWRLGISSNHIEAFLLLLAFGLSILDNLERVTGGLMQGVFTWVLDFTSNSTGGLLLFLSMVVLLFSIVISLLRIVLQYFDFSISTSPKGFRIRSGLINVKQKLVPYRKVQYISWKANLIRRKMQIYLLHFHASGASDMREKQQVKVPVTRPEFIPAILNYYQPLLETEAIEPVRVDPAYILRRVLRNGLLPAIFLSAALYTFWEWNAFWFFLLVPYTTITAILFQKKFRLWPEAEALRVKRGSFGEEQLMLQWHRIQSVTMKQSLFQRRRGLASLHLHTAGGTVSVPFIPIGKARALRDYALYMVEFSGREWM